MCTDMHHFQKFVRDALDEFFGLPKRGARIKAAGRDVTELYRLMKHPGPTGDTPRIDYNGGMKSRWNLRVVELAHAALLEMRPDYDSGDLLKKVTSKHVV